MYVCVMFSENDIKTNIRATFKSIQNHTCIKFKQSKLTRPITTSAKSKFAVVFSKVGYRYVLYNDTCLQETL